MRNRAWSRSSSPPPTARSRSDQGPTAPREQPAGVSWLTRVSLMGWSVDQMCLPRLVITDAMWSRIEPLMPADPVRGRRWADHRRTLEAIAWKYRTNSPCGTCPTSSARSRPPTNG
ncbi:transposase [Streptomyces sp. NPDC056222]|uniref:transposase n=1 Tax=Streptomyces sp. NPDC056222 TaxID=3345749 RepID=UPI0035D6B44C